MANNLHIAIVGAGIGGLTCALACRRANPPLNVTIFEKTSEILTIGAGIHIPPNAFRELARLGLADKLRAAGGYEVDNFTLRRYEDGRLLARKPLNVNRRAKEVFGAEWIAIQRGDYQNILLQEALAAGATVLTSAEVANVVESASERQTIFLKDGRNFKADVIIGADGLWSMIREIVLEHPFAPQETGDLAYRCTFTREALEATQNTRLKDMLQESDIQVFLGADRHAVFYPLRDHTEYNLVLLCADDMPSGSRTLRGSLAEMAAIFEGWDPILTDIISCSKEALKWKLLHFKELDRWTKGPIALLGDASHPTLPYQGQGAAMAVEDGVVLGLLLGSFQGLSTSGDALERNASLTSLLRLYEDLRKKRTEVNVAGAVDTRHWYHLPDGEAQKERDADLMRVAQANWTASCSFVWADATYQQSLLGFDVVEDAKRRFEGWAVGLQKQSSTAIETNHRL